jgi:hypothetical protein
MSELFANFDKKKKDEETPLIPVVEEPEPVTVVVPELVPEPVPTLEPEPVTSLFAKTVEEPKREIPTPIVGSTIKPSTQGLFATAPASTPQPAKTAVTLDDEGAEMVRQADHDFGAITSLAEEQYEAKDIIMVYGEKGGGKSTFSLEFPGNILAISLDRKTMKVKKNASGEPRIVVEGKDLGPKRVRVFDVISYADMSDINKYGQSLVTIFEYTMKLMQDWDKNNPDFPIDWIMIDGAEELARMAEAMMRWRHGLEMEDGVKNRNIWKYRRFIIKQLHNLALSKARRGIIYTTFIDYDEIIKSGQLVDKKEMPKWLDVIKLETDHVFRVGIDSGRFFAFLESGKGIQSQRKFDVTGKELVTKVVTEFVEQIQG